MCHRFIKHFSCCLLTGEMYIVGVIKHCTIFWVMTVGNSVGETKEANCAPHVVPLLHTCTCTIVGAGSGVGSGVPPPGGYFAPVISCVTTTLNKLKCYKCTWTCKRYRVQVQVHAFSTYIHIVHVCTLNTDHAIMSTGSVHVVNVCTRYSMYQVPVPLNLFLDL